MDAFEMLKADHRKVAELFDQLEDASGKGKLHVFKRIKSELELHTHIEETILYPSLEKPEETHDLTLEAYEEHKVVKRLLAELSGAGTATDEWQAKAKVLRENVEHHVDEEEKELFDKAEDALSDEELEALREQMAAEKARKQGQPAPKKSDARDKTKKPGIISKIADFVGLGSGTTRKAAKKSAAKAPAKKKSAARKSSTRARKSSPAPGKRASATKGAKRNSGSKPGSKKRSTRSSGTKAKKRTGRK